MLTDGSQLVARRLSSATTSKKSWASILIPRFRWMYKSRPLQRYATSTFVPSATSVHYWPCASPKRSRMGWWQLGWITATRCCRGHQQITLRDCSASRTVLLELSSALRGRRPLNPCSRSCTGFQCNNVWPTRSVFWCTRPCRTRNQRICTPYWFLTNQLDACDRRIIPCWPRDISIR